MYKHDITIISKSYYFYRPQRKHGKNIIKGMLQLRLMTQKLIEIDACRIYLQVLNLDDMVTPNGINFFE